MHDVYLLLGSNLGDRRAWLTYARKLIAQDIGDLRQVSSLYETAPWGLTDQPGFINQVVCVATHLSPPEVLARIGAIEDAAGRQRTEQWGPRTLDIDILFYDDLVVGSETLTLPHPQLPHRRFALVPLCEIAPDMMHPVRQMTVKDLLRQCPDHSEVAILPER